MHPIVTVISRHTTKFEVKRAAILDAALQILYRRGVKGMTLSAVGGEVGLNSASVTHYFPRKEDLAVACYLTAIERLEEILAAAVRELDARRRLSQVFAGMFAWHRGIRRGEQAQFVPFADVRALDSPHREVVENAFAAMARNARALFDGPEFAALDRASRTVRAHLLLEQLFWLTSWLYDFDIEDYPRVLERTCNIYLNGLMDSDGEPESAPQALLAPRLEPAIPAAKEEFLIAATRTLNQFGYWGASVERISASVSATKGAFYHHHMSKDELVISCFHRSFDLMKAAQTDAIAHADSAWEALKTAVYALGDFQLSDRGPLLRLFLLTSLPEHMRHKLVAHANRIRNRYTALISDGARDGSLRLVDPLIAAQMLRVSINALASGSAWVKGLEPPQAQRLYLRPLLFGALTS